MSDFGGSSGWLLPHELTSAGCGRDCHCTNTTCRMARELRERRSQDLTAEDREALEWAREHFKERAERGYRELSERAERAIAALAKLVEGGGR